MFIGASPGSCGGGVKTINAAILVIMAKNRFKGREEGEVFKRTIPRETLSRSVTIILSSVVLISVVACLVMISETGGYTHPQTRGKFLEYLFETVSAFGTVGLSMGVTSTLTTLGKILIMIMMFLGRLGPLNLAFSLAKRAPITKFQYGEEKVFIG
jgi:trk system potassium uptake protein TrkH